MKLSQKLSISFVLSIILLMHAVNPVMAGTLRRALSDINRDGIISKADKELLLANFHLVNPVGTKALADVNQDGVINAHDLVLINKNIGQIVSACEMADISNDGTVNSTDLNIIGQYYAQEDNSANMMADLNGDGIIDIGDLSKAGGLFGCNW